MSGEWGAAVVAFVPLRPPQGANWRRSRADLQSARHRHGAVHAARGVPARNGADPVDANRQAMAMLYAVVRQQASVLSFLTVFRTIGVVFLVIIPLILILRKPKHLRERQLSS